MHNICNNNNDYSNDDTINLHIKHNNSAGVHEGGEGEGRTVRADHQVEARHHEELRDGVPLLLLICLPVFLFTIHVSNTISSM